MRFRTVCRSLLLALLLALFSWGKPSRVRAGTPGIEAEIGTYGGTASGEFRSAGCASAPAARIRYQGLGARVTLRPADASGAAGEVSRQARAVAASCVTVAQRSSS